MQERVNVPFLWTFLGDVWCTMDEIKLMLECFFKEDVQNRFYNGWTFDHYIGAVLVFCPDGTQSLLVVITSLVQFKTAALH